MAYEGHGVYPYTSRKKNHTYGHDVICSRNTSQDLNQKDLASARQTMISAIEGIICRAVSDSLFNSKWWPNHKKEVQQIKIKTEIEVINKILVENSNPASVLLLQKLKSDKVATLIAYQRKLEAFQKKDPKISEPVPITQHRITTAAATIAAAAIHVLGG